MAVSRCYTEEHLNVEETHANEMNAGGFLWYFITIRSYVIFCFCSFLQVPGSNFADLLDVSEDHDFFIVGLQEAPNVDLKSSLSEILGVKYWCDLSFLHKPNLLQFSPITLVLLIRLVHSTACEFGVLVKYASWTIY